MIITGAGLAGLLAANMLRRHKPLVFEAQDSLPNNHDALLRFRSDAVSRVTGIPFRKVRVLKAVCDEYSEVTNVATLRNINMYSRKVTNEVIGRSISDLSPVERYIAPPDLIRQMAASVTVRYERPLSMFDILGAKEDRCPILSTIPMPYLMEIVKWKQRPNFNYRAATIITCDIRKPLTDVYQTIYFPTAEWRCYRASITGAHLIIECADAHVLSNEQVDKLIREVLGRFGVGFVEYDTLRTKVQSFGKIAPIPEEQRKEFILAMSDMYGIYSVGRYATWRNILLDDVVDDIQTVEKMITQRDGYRAKLAAAGQQA